MVKGNPKSSASSATRKKHLKKHAQPDDQAPKEKRPKVKGEKGKKKSEPRVKMYIPPVKPAPVQPDPLETTGLAHSLPADLLIVLRNISKKAQVTKTRALEELQGAWVNQCLKEGRDSPLTYTLVEMLPVWFHHVSSLFVNPSRRVRLLAVSLHSSLLQIPPVREQMVFFLGETASSSQLEDILGTWCLAMHDVDRSVSAAASKSWTDIVVTSSPSINQFLLSDGMLVSLNSFVERAVLDPSGVYLYLNPLPPPPPPPSSVPKKGAGKGSSVSTPRKDEGDQTPRSKQEEHEENDQDRRARLRIAGLGALRWLLSAGSTTFSEEIQAFYSNPVLWSIIQPAESCPWVDVESFGFGQPNVRKSGWSLLQTLLSSHKDHLETLLPTLGTAILRSAWVESDPNVHGAMWQPLLVFLKQFPQSWGIEQNRKENESDSDGESETEGPSAKEIGEKSSPAYLEFLQFLRSGCSGSPTQGYPAVVIIISTIPPSILTSTPGSPLSQLFESFWEACESRALSSLHRVVASSAFLSSLLECLVFLVRRLRNDRSRPSEADGTTTNECEALVHQQFSALWDRLTTQKLKVEERAAARLIAQTLEALFNVDQALFQDGWDIILEGMKSSSKERENVHLISAILKVFYDRFKKDTILKTKSEDMLREILKDCLERCEHVLSINSEEHDGGDTRVVFELLLSVLDQFREGLFFDEVLSEKLDNLLCQRPIQVLSLSHGLFLSYLVHRKDERKCLQVWHSLLSAIASKSADGRVLEENSIGRLLEAAQKGQLPKYLKPQDGELDGLVGSLLEKALGGPLGSNDILLLRNVLLSFEYFISKSGFNTLLEIIIATFSSSVDCFINGGDSHTSSDSETATSLVQAVFGNIKEESELLVSLMPNLFLFAYLIPAIGANGVEVELTSSQTMARTLWEEWLLDATDVGKTEILMATKSRLKDILGNTSVNPVPEDILNMASDKPPGLDLDYLQDLFPSSSELGSMLSALTTDPIDSSIAVLDPLIPAFSKQGPKDSHRPSTTDYRGFSVYARIISGLLQLFSDERWLAKRNLWALRHIYALSIYAQDLLAVPSAVSRSPVFDDKVTPGALNHIVEKTRQVSVYLLNSAQSQEGENWRRSVLDRFLNDAARGNNVEDLTQLQAFLFNTITYAKERDFIRDTRTLKMVLDSLLVDSVDAAEADIWIQVARKLEKAAPQTSMTIIAVVTSTGAEPPKLDRYRNELAAGLLGIKARHANVEGLLNLRKLYATAPDPNGDVIFLPPPRAVNVVKACQSWVLSDNDDDDELEEEVQSAMLPIFLHLAPILQNVPGSHWAFIFDVLEAVLEVSAEEDEGETGSEEGSKLVGLSRALKLVIALEDLAKRNKSLMAEWSERRIGVLTSIRDLGVISSDPVELSSIPRSTCRELVLLIVQDLPPSLLDQDTLPKMCHLIEDPSYVVQKMAYQLLKAAARKRTEYFVIEAGVDTESVVQSVLPAELLDIVLRQMDFGERGNSDEETNGEQTQNIFGYLLGWMLVFDLFQDASFKVKSSYIEQLKSLNAVVDHFIPCFLGLLHLDRGGLSKAFKLDIWAIDQFFVELYRTGSPHTIPVLVAHVYYRALLTIPSLIHSWMLDCKDRQLSNTVTTYTSTHFSPVLIRAELDHVRTHATADGLADDNLSIKVATSVNEVVAAYLVDEHQLEIKLRIPSDWPLHKIEVRDVKRIGVDENRWRAWVLGVQQTIWAQNGRIIDGLGLFKKNVTLHFEGQVECAICYSIISVMDGSLPKKPCKTCKNRFHAGCLYKWFNTSHSSSCPLCRSDII